MSIFKLLASLLSMMLITASPAALAEEQDKDVSGFTIRPSVRASESKVEAMMSTPAEHAANHADPTYICPMHPQIQQGTPGGCPICGMALVLKKEASNPSATGGNEAPAVHVSSSIAQSMGIRTGSVKKSNLHRTINTFGTVQYDGDYLYQIHSKNSGWLREVKVHAPGDAVSKDGLLFTYTMEGAGKIVDKVNSPATGVVAQTDVRVGMYITPAMPLYTIADTLTMWVVAEVFSDQMARLEVGRTAIMTLDSLPGREWKGVIDSISPALDAKTRTVGVRLRFKNLDQALKPNMLANVKLFTRPKEGVLTVPREALIPAADGYRVVKAMKEVGHYQPVPVTVGERSDDKVEILKGLEANDEVVLSGQFMLDSESNLQASFRRLSQ